MPVRIGAGLSTATDPRAGAIEAATAARSGLEGEQADLAMVFASGAHLATPEAMLEGVHEAIRPLELAGCGAAGVLAGGRELEEGTAVAVWAAALDGGQASVVHLPTPSDGDTIEGLDALADADAALLIVDPYGFPAERALQDLSELAPGMPVVGGLASARAADGDGALWCGDEVVDGAVAVRLDGVSVLPCVSQGAAPVGPELTITAGGGSQIGELAGVAAISKIREVVAALPDAERELLAEGLLLGVAVGSGAPGHGQPDYLVRGVLGADPDTGVVAIGAGVRTGQQVRLHARDAESADRNLHDELALRVRALGDRPPAGALCFTCNGRGTSMFARPDHDAQALAKELDGAPAAGFFAAGEIGPVGGYNFLHGFTATVAIFGS